MKLLRYGCVVCCVWLLTGCPAEIKPPLVELPVVESPESWRQLSLPGSLADQGWLSHFASEPLRQLVAEALAANPDLQNSRALLAAALARQTVEGAPLSPTLDAELGAGRSKSSSGSISDSFAAGLSASWEADLWRKLSDRARAAALDAEAQAEVLSAARLSLAARVSQAWFSAVEAELQLGLSRDLVENLEASLAVLEEGYNAGIVDALDIHLARANLESERARLATRVQTRADNVRVLELQLGRYPAEQLKLARELPALPAPVPAGLPSELLQRRYDIRAADRRFRGAVARVSAAHKDRFPSLRLTADYGISSDDLGDLLSGKNLAWSALVSLTAPLFDGGRRQGLEALAVAEAEQAAAGYLQTLLTAFSEVESTLQQEQQLIATTAALQLSSEQSDYAESLAFEQYRSGLVDYITVLEAQRRAFAARSSYLEARNRQLQNRISLYLALGGDFSGDQTVNLQIGSGEQGGRSQ